MDSKGNPEVKLTRSRTVGSNWPDLKALWAVRGHRPRSAAISASHTQHAIKAKLRILTVDCSTT